MEPAAWALIAGAYLMGSIPFGLLVCKALGAPDPRRSGSGNLGATNVSRLAGRPAGVATLLLDVAKSALPTWLALQTQAPLVVGLTGLAAFVGHCWPIYLGFKGGKGVACALGVYLVISPPALLAAVAVLAIAVWRTGYMSVGSLLCCASAPLWLWVYGSPWELVAMAGAVAAIVFWRHRSNIARLRIGAERPWR